ncbi:hypothetical protein, partial [Neisseria gonorrhoeae]
MANATEQNQFDQAVRLIESGDSVVVGPGAPVNQPLQALANRTLLLKNQTEALQTASDTKAAPSHWARPGKSPQQAKTPSQKTATPTPSTPHAPTAPAGMPSELSFFHALQSSFAL